MGLLRENPAEAQSPQESTTVDEKGKSFIRFYHYYKWLVRFTSERDMVNAAASCQQERWA